VPANVDGVLEADMADCAQLAVGSEDGSLRLFRFDNLPIIEEARDPNQVLQT